MDFEASDKENATPASPPPSEGKPLYPSLPFNRKGNIVIKHPFTTIPASHSHSQPSPNTARKRSRLGNHLSTTPPRPSRSSQIRKVFQDAATSSPKSQSQSQSQPILDLPTTSPPIPPEALKIFQHFNQAFRTTREEPRRQEEEEEEEEKKKKKKKKAVAASGLSSPLRNSKSVVSSHTGDSEDERFHFLVRDQEPTVEYPHLPGARTKLFPDREPYRPARRLSEEEVVAGCEEILSEDDMLKKHSRFGMPSHPESHGMILQRPRQETNKSKSPPRSSDDDDDGEDPLNDLERAIAASFSPSPSRSERRKTLDLSLSKVAPAPPPSPKEADSTDSWTGDEIFFPGKKPASVCAQSPSRSARLHVAAEIACPQPQRPMGKDVNRI
ncbi:Hypothetical predicted protein [Lecanosticta acicola]|uniref:Uncharacterized protein n=1 Tax=Lecanosticta acicola TaxID=111012 RepID=A0AAI8YPJ9_9PEZI|nr:Hypothetical predicted protein [Lecanosticta acicola]